jgi:prevent-host-death family protein
MRAVPLSALRDDLSRFVREAVKRDIVITRHGKPAGVLIGFESDADWVDYRRKTDPQFQQRIAKTRGRRTGNRS